MNKEGITIMMNEMTMMTIAHSGTVQTKIMIMIATMMTKILTRECIIKGVMMVVMTMISDTNAITTEVMSLKEGEIHKEVLLEWIHAM